MRKRVGVVASAVVLGALGMLSSGHAQTSQSSAADSEQAKRGLAVNLLRRINTAEVRYRHNHGTYAASSVLFGSVEFANDRPAEPTQGFVYYRSKPLADLPGWKLRLDVNADGSGYDILLEDTNDKTCGYAALTDERGLIRQSKAIDCEI